VRARSLSRCDAAALAGALALSLGLVAAGVVAAPRAARAQEGAALAGAVDTARAKAVEDEIAALAERTSPAYLVVSGGSGVLISPDGWALTNHHVVASRELGDRWWVRSGDGARLRATLVGTDPRGDIALLRCEARRPLPCLPLGDSDALEIGDLVIALGNPYGFATRDAAPTVTLGIVSALHAYRQNYNDAIQTDAAINPGNSGGPLVNRRGEVVGINGRVAVRFGNRMNTGVGYSIPSNQIRRFLPRLQAGGVVPHGWIPGLTLAETEGGGGAGARVDDVSSGSVAATLGLAPGDVIVKVGDRAVRSPSGYHGAIGCFPAGDEVPLLVRRDGDERVVSATLVPLGQRTAAAPSGPRAWLGVRIRAARAAERDREGDEEGADIEVVEALASGPAARAGIETGDVIVAIGTKPVRAVDDVGEILGDLKPGAKVAVDVRRAGRALTLEVELARAP
jgi:serine protease Do